MFLNISESRTDNLGINDLHLYVVYGHFTFKKGLSCCCQAPSSGLLLSLAQPVIRGLRAPPAGHISHCNTFLCLPAAANIQKQATLRCCLRTKMLLCLQTNTKTSAKLL